MQILSHGEVEAAIVRLVLQAESRLLLVSPYFDPWNRLALALESAISVNNVDTVIVVRGGRDAVKQLPMTEPFSKVGAKVFTLERLHAKVYYNEHEAIVTSMNLLQSSAMDSWEIAIRLSRDEDTHEYDELTEVLAELMDMVRLDQERLRARMQAEKKRQRAPKAEDKSAALSSVLGRLTSAPKKRRKNANDKLVVVDSGVCIRCGDDLALNPERPFCRACYREWAKEDAPGKETFCHRCGKETRTSLEKPVCYPCFKSMAVK